MNMHLEIISRTNTRRAIHVTLALIVTLVMTSITPSVTFAQAQWQGGVQGGAVIRNGEQSNRLRLSFTKDDRPISQNVYADWIFGSGDDAFEVGYRPRYWFDPSLYAFGELNVRTDPLVAIDLETGQTLGIGYQLLRTASQAASIEVGAGARQISFDDESLEDLNQPFGRARVSFLQLLGETSRFQFDGASTFSDEVTETSAEVGVTLQLDTVALTLGYRVINQRIDGLPSVTDDTTTFSIGYAL